jgi:hypothetical protein
MQRSLGSGVLVDASGLVVTNNHVIDGATEVKVSLADKREFEAEVVLVDARTDLAVLRLKAQGERFPAIDFADSDALQVGDIVLAIGNPFAVGQTVTHGIVSAVARTQVGITDYQFFIQTDAAINPGNSGGALVDMTGKLVGINTAIFSRSGGSIGIGFAIPSDMVKTVVAQAIAGSTTVARPWIGVSCPGHHAGYRRLARHRQPARRAGHARRQRLPRREGRPQGRRSHRQGLRCRRRRHDRARLPPGGRRDRQPGSARGVARRRHAALQCGGRGGAAAR